jgi:predicted ATPase/DNA-binding winged helix-turn-helix (wHTH) protein
MNSANLAAPVKSSKSRGEIAFGPFRLFPDSGHLFREREKIPLGHRAVEILTLLVSRAGELITHEEIVAHAWPKSIVEDNNLRVQISAIRKALNEKKSAYIQNIPGRGYRFTLTPAPGDAEGHADLILSQTAMSSCLVGREEDLEAVQQSLVDSRCVTIVGSGGIGKTALAAQVGEHMKSAYADGLAFVDLSAATRDDEVSTLLLTALGVSPFRDTHLLDLVDFLRSRHFLLVVESCEHVIGGASALIAMLLAQTTYLTVLVTSREPLRIVGERVYRLAHLAWPPVQSAEISLREVMQFPAAMLFCERAVASAGVFRLSEQDAFSLAMLCNKLDGIPLAIELAAGRVQGLGLRGLLLQIDNYFGILTGGRRSASARQRTLQTTLDWSYRLLTGLEKTVLARLSIFRWSFSLDCARQVVRDRNVVHEEIVAALNSLIEKSLVVAETDSQGTTFRLLQTTRAYAAEKVKDDVHIDQVRRRYAMSILALAEALTPQGPADEAGQHCRYLTLIDEVREALAWALSEAGDVGLAADILLKSRYLWFHLSRLGEYIDLTELVVSRACDGRAAEWVRVLLVSMAPAIYNAHGPIPRMREVLEKGVGFAKAHSDLNTLRFGLRGLWNYHHGLAEYAQSIHVATQYREVRTRDVESATMLATINGINFLQKGRLRRAFRYLEFANMRSNPHFTQTTDAYDYHQRVVETAVMARIAWLLGHFTMAFTLIDECVDAAGATERPTSMVYALAVAVCPILLWSGRLEAAAPRIRTLQTLAAAHSMQHWVRYGELFGLSLAFLADKTAMEQGLHAVRRDAWSPRHMEEFSVLPGGRIPPSFLTRANSSSPVWCSAENLRVAAVRQLEVSGNSGIPQAVALLNTSMALASKQGARTWELRAALSLAPILAKQKKRIEARDMIARLVERFDAGTATDDLLYANALLRQLT